MGYKSGGKLEQCLSSLSEEQTDRFSSLLLPRFSQIAVVSYLAICRAKVLRETHNHLFALQNSIFKIETFRLESNSSNEIYLEVATDALARALKSAAVSPLSLCLTRALN